MFTKHELIESIGIGNVAKYRIEILHDKIYIQAPAQIDVYWDENRDSTLTFLAIVARLGLDWKVRTLIDMKACQKLTAAAAVMLFSEVTRIQLASNNAQAVAITPPKGQLKRAFEDSGLHAGIKPGTARKLKKLLESAQPFQSCDDPQQSLKSIMSYMAKAGLDLSRPHAKVFSRGVQEAMLNVMHHAYHHEFAPKSGIGKRWWHACWYDKPRNSMSFIIYDKGGGIPSTLGSPDLPRALDEDIIEHSMRRGVSCLPDPSRGKGLVDIQKAASIYKGSILFVASNYGIVIVRNEGKSVEKHSSNQSFNGTLLEWKFNLGVSDEEI